MKKSILFLFLLIFSFLLHAQTQQTICGIVTDLSGNPVVGVTVYIQGDSAANPLNTHYSTQVTDANGMFCDTVTIGTNSNQFIVTVIDCQNWPNNTTVNLNNINTTLAIQICWNNNPPPPSCDICGLLITTNSLPNTDSSMVWLIRYDSITTTLTAIDSTLSFGNNPNGSQYCFYNVAPGTYRVKAALDPANPGYSTHVPTYYGNALQWNFASVVSVCPSVSNANITFIAGTNPGGPGFIGGLVSQGANKTQNTALVGVTVVLKNNLGQLIDWTLTDANGAYSFPNLAYGTYHISVDALNLHASEKIVTLSAGNPSETNVDVEMNLNPNTSISAGADLSQHLHFYPNPAHSTLHLNYQGLQNNAELNLSIMDISGMTLSTKALSLSETHGAIALDIHNIANGLYIFRIEDSRGNSMHQKVSIQR
jgi:hypothetical protein